MLHLGWFGGGFWLNFRSFWDLWGSLGPTLAPGRLFEPFFDPQGTSLGGFWRDFGDHFGTLGLYFGILGLTVSHLFGTLWGTDFHRC